jgi:WD40 repeat protein
VLEWEIRDGVIQVSFSFAFSPFCLCYSSCPSNFFASAPSQPSHVSTLPSAANVLHVSIESFEDGSFSQAPQQLLFTTTADRRLHILYPDSNFSLERCIGHLQDSPILSCVPLGKTYLTTISCGMSGQVVLYDHKEDKVLEERRDHKKYVVKVAVWENEWVATAGWDAKVFLYKISSEIALLLGSPVAVVHFPTNPETITFIKPPDLDQTILLVTRRDSTSLYYYSLPTTDELSMPKSEPAELELLGLQNLAPHSNAWIAFSPSSVAVCPTDPTLLAVATSAVPHMKLILVRLLVPSSAAVVDPTTQVAQTRANLAIQDKEDTAIQVHVSTLAPQTPYSTPQVVWRPDGSGVWVNGDDGVLRGLEAKTGKIVATLKNGHEPGSKIRSIWCGTVNVGEGTQEWVVSGGFDRRLVVWKPDERK